MRLLAVLAHPDDESLGVGGTLAKYAAEGVDVFLLTATRGDAGRFHGVSTRSFAMPHQPLTPGRRAGASVVPCSKPLDECPFCGAAERAWSANNSARRRRLH